MISTLASLPGKAGEFLKNQPWVRNILILVLIFAMGYGAGRYAQPAKVVIQDRVVTVEKKVVVTEVKTEIKIVKVADTSVDRKVHKTVTETEKPDGTKTKVTTEDSDTSKKTHEDDTTVAKKDDTSKTTDNKAVDSSHTSITTYSKPQWHLGANGGISIPYFIGQGVLGVPGMKGFVVGAQLERRIVGPVFMGIVGNTQGMVGISISGEF